MGDDLLAAGVKKEERIKQLVALQGDAAPAITATANIYVAVVAAALFVMALPCYLDLLVGVGWQESR
jgi:hypothetical protein